MIKSIKFLNGFPTTFPHIGTDRIFKFTDGLNFIYGQNGCLVEGTLVSTTNGIKKIENLVVGDFVYDENGKPAKILQTFNTGIKKVVELKNEGKIWAESTYDHVWFGKSRRQKIDKGWRTLDFTKNHKVLRVNPFKSMGEVDFPEAYFLGIALGDGCCVQKTSNYHISSACEDIIKKCSSILQDSTYKKLSGNNYTWEIKVSERLPIYDKWCHKRKAHEKIADYDVVKNWNRESICKFIAGLIDSDGSIPTISHKRLSIVISMQSRTVIETLQKLFLELWGVDVIMHTSNSDKYINGPIHYISVKRTDDVYNILSEISEYLLHPNKKDKFNIIDSENMKKRKYISLELGEESLKQTYDIHIDTDTNLYCLANGLVTHNSGKSVLAKTLAAYCGIEKGGWSRISEPAKLATKFKSHFPVVYRQYTPNHIDAQVEWDGVPTFYYDSELMGKNDMTWFFQNASQSADGVTTESEQMDILATKPSSGQYRISKINKIMQLITRMPDLSQIPADIVTDRQYAQMEIDYIKDLPRDGKPTLILDEPERGLVLPRQFDLFKVFDKLAEHFQVIVISHSPFILFHKNANIIDFEPGYMNTCKKLIKDTVCKAGKKSKDDD